MITAGTPLRDVAGAVASALRDLGYEAVVVGGSASTLHAPDAYLSDDIDIVIVGGIDEPRKVVDAMASLGFELTNHMFVHRSNRYMVEFVPSPVSIASDIIVDYAQIETDFGPVRVLHPADAVCDRLNKYIVWADRGSLDVAVSVARACDVDLRRVEAFIDRHAAGPEGKKFTSGYQRFRRALEPEGRAVSRFGFATTVRLDFLEPPTHEVASDVLNRIALMLDEERAAIDGLDGVDVRGEPVVNDDLVLLALSMRTVRDLRYVDMLRVALDAIDHLRTRLDRFPEVNAVLDDEAPSVAAAWP